jgi:hypothetical protein
MGLDMVAVTMPRADAPVKVDFDLGEDMRPPKLHYWRKHPNLHGWMRALYIESGGDDENFNIAPLRLDAEDIDRLENAVRNRLLPHTTGFFFGESDGSELADDLDFIAKAREAIAAGLAVVYIAWW